MYEAMHIFNKNFELQIKRFYIFSMMENLGKNLDKDLFITSKVLEAFKQTCCMRILIVILSP